MPEPMVFPDAGRPKRPHPQRELAIADLFARQKTVATLDQLEELGLGRRAVRHRAAIGRLHCLYPAVYSSTPPSLLPPKARWLAAVLACGGDAYLSHRSAAALLGLQSTLRSAIDVTTPDDRGRRLDGIDAHRAATLTPADVTAVEGIPCTSVARTVLDLAAVAPRRRVERAIDQAEVLEIFDLRAFDDVLARNPTLRGAPIVLDLLAEYQREDAHLATLTESELEEGFLALCDAAGFPRPEVQQYLTLPSGDVIRADFLWRELRVVVETDGHQGHKTPWARERDARRDLLLTEAGWRPVRLTKRMVFKTPAETTRTFGSVLGQAALALSRL
ncbi:MAG: endonuclease domain-containing protein [Actinomycetota bacterium]|nr:endonuclease domain-containing protein [Actinomycetota bacterium]